LKLLRKGAEAYLYKDEWFGKSVMIKKRIPKKYRNEKLDLKIRSLRTISEGKLLTEARKVGVLTPFVYEIDPNNYSITMDFINGPRLKEALNKKRVKIFESIGAQVAKLHKNNIVHGDLTTSNIILINNEYTCLIDFGLGAFTTSIEDFGVDIHLMKRALNSTHSKLAKECYDLFLNGYEKHYSEKYKDIIFKIEEIESRGRYVNRKEGT